MTAGKDFQRGSLFNGSEVKNTRKGGETGGSILFVNTSHNSVIACAHMFREQSEIIWNRVRKLMEVFQELA